MTNGTFNQCSGTFYDSGGEFGNYGNNENFVTTICPDIAGNGLVLNFNFFATQIGSNADVMNIYDGDSTAATLIGSYQGSASPGTVLASGTNPTGCLTIEFISSTSGNTTGWEATIDCYEPCQTIIPSITSTSEYRSKLLLGSSKFAHSPLYTSSSTI